MPFQGSYAGYSPGLLVEVFTNAVAGAKWKQEGDEGAIIPLPGGLVIYQSLMAHEEIEKLLRKLERYAESRPLLQPLTQQPALPEPTERNKAPVPSF